MGAGVLDREFVCIDLAALADCGEHLHKHLDFAVGRMAQAMALPHMGQAMVEGQARTHRFNQGFLK